MKTEIIDEDIEMGVIDWGKCQVLAFNANIPNKKLLILTDGQNKESTFSGTVLYSEATGRYVGEYSQDWSKALFVKVNKSTITIKFKMKS